MLLSPPPLVPSQLCVVMIFLVTVVLCRGIITVIMFHTKSHLLQTQVCISLTAPPPSEHALIVHARVCVILSSGSNHRQHLEQLCEFVPHPADGTDLHRLS